MPPTVLSLPASIPSPSSNGVHLGPFDLHVYGLMYVIGILAALTITRRRWQACGGDPALADDVALWAVPAGIVGGRIYFDVTTPDAIQPHWYGFLAVWEGGLGIWGGIALAAVVGIWRLRRAGVDVGRFMDAVAPALLVAQGIGRIGNYFNQELFGGPTSLPWALRIAPQFRPPGYGQYATFHPTFLYELLFDLAWAAALVWLGHHRRVRPPGLFALYVAGYSGFRIFEESLRVDYSEHFLGLRLNTFVASGLLLVALVWFVATQRRPDGGDPMTASTALPLADTSDMVGLHRVFREALAAAPALVGGTPDGDGDRAELVGSYYANVLELLHGHHEGEDVCLTPRLLARVPEHEATIRRVGEQHQAVLATVGATERAVDAWRATPSAGCRDAALASLAALEAQLTPHLDEEEREILPLAAGCIDEAEWGELPAHGLGSFRGDKMWLVIGLIQEQMTEPQRAAMMARMPPPVLHDWESSGRERFTAYVAELRR